MPDDLGAATMDRAAAERESDALAAILDHLVMNAIRFNIDGPSYRQRVAAERANKAGRKSKK